MVLIAAIAHNPYRTLGVFSNSTKREILQNKSRITRYFAVGKPTRFACDLVPIIGPIERTEASVNEACARLESNADRIKHALFWPISNPTSLDESYALDLICSGDPGKAAIVLRDSVSYSSLINRAVASFLSDDLPTAIQSIDWLLSVDQYREQFVRAVCGEFFNITQTEVYDLFIGELCDSYNPIVIYESIYEKEPLKHFLDVFSDRLAGVYAKRASSKLAQYSKDVFASTYDIIECAEKVYRDIYLPIEGLKALIDANDELRLISDKIVTRLLDLTIDAHNKALKRKEEGAADEYNSIGPRCAKVIGGIVRQNLSAPVLERLDKNRKIMSSNVSNNTSSVPQPTREKVQSQAKTQSSPVKTIVVKKPFKERIKDYLRKKK